MDRVYKCFKVNENYYMYDREQNDIVNISKKEYDLLKEINSEEIFEKYQALFKPYLEKGFLKKTALTQIEHPYTHRIQELTTNRLTQLVLQVTQDCNLRCSYCFYGEGNYMNRTHNHKRMSFEQAKEGIDYLLSHSKALETVYLSFYGGEPLLCIDLIKQCIAYINTRVEGKQIYYNLTTNGTLLTDEIIQFLMKHNISIMISLDGNKEIHDMNRKYASGKGSFETIMENIKYIREEYPEYVEKISFNTVLAPKNDLQCVTNFFDTDEIIGDSLVSTGVVSDVYTNNDYSNYSEKFSITNSYGLFKRYLAETGRLDKQYTSQLYKGRIISLQRLYKQLYSQNGGYKVGHPGGPCLPGVRRIFVNVDGTMYPCERVSEKSKVMTIGNLKEGIDLEKVKALINVGQLTQEECLKCWAFHYCTTCGAYADDIDVFSKERKLRHCEYVKNNVLEDFMDFCMLKDFNYDFEGDIYK